MVTGMKRSEAATRYEGKTFKFGTKRETVVQVIESGRRWVTVITADPDTLEWAGQRSVTHASLK